MSFPIEHGDFPWFFVCLPEGTPQKMLISAACVDLQIPRRTLQKMKVAGEQLVEGGSSLVPSGKLTFCYGKSPFLMGKLVISMAMFDSKLLNYQRVTIFFNHL